jgi:hypothetical protein
MVEKTNVMKLTAQILRKHFSSYNLWR